MRLDVPLWNDLFPSMLPGWKAEKTPGGYMMISPRAGGRGAIRGFATRISCEVRPQDPGGREGRGGGGATRITVPWEGVAAGTRDPPVSTDAEPQSVPAQVSVVLVEETKVMLRDWYSFL